MIFKLLTRDQFRNAVFERDRYKCVCCGAPAVDAHHIIERRLFPDGGYYLENGASVCESCHLKAESTEIMCDDLRYKIGIKQFPIPPHLYRDQPYDKWGNPLLPNGNRVKGELFEDVSVKKILAPVIHLFIDRVKYPRTYHLPWSPGATSDDRIMDDLSTFKDMDIVVTVKMDGENTTMYNDYLHARSLNYEPHPSRDRIKSLHASIKYDIPNGWRVCGENLYAKHSIAYENLSDYFLVFSIWDNKNICLSWKETCMWVELLNLKMVPVLYEGKWDESMLRKLEPKTHDGDVCEGYVVRPSEQFGYGQFRTHVGKYVRKDHVQTHGHWMRSVITPNKLKD